MSDRSIVVRIRAEVNGFRAAMQEASRASEELGKRAEKSAQQADTAMGRMVQSARANSAQWTTAGATLAGFGAAALGALGLATKAAMDWESSWAGVAKTVDGTAPQMAALEAGLRGLARELPASHQEIAAVAEAAGQLGVAREDILSFTATMINLGESTNLSADEAATSIAQFSNVMGTSSEDVGRLGSALVALGNDGASTEAEIMGLAQRLSGAGAMIGASEQDVLGLSSALASVGITAEAGGSALSRVLQKINTDVLAGGEDMAAWAEVAGVSAQDFAAAWRESPVQALDMFLQGLDGVSASGGNAVAVLSDLGIKSTEETRALLSLAGAGDLLSRSLATSSEGWAENTALAMEAAKRYETAESRIQLAKNALVDAGISIGGVLLPHLAAAADGVADLAGWFADLPGPVHEVIAGLGGLAGAASLAAGGFLLILPRAIEAYDAFQRVKDGLAGMGPGASKAVSALTRVGVALGGMMVLAEIGDSMQDYTLGMEEMTATALKLSDSATPMADVFAGMIPPEALGNTQDMAQGLDVLANGRWWTGIQDKGTQLFNLVGKGGATIEEQRQRLADYGDSLSLIAETNLPAAQEAFAALLQDAGGTQQAFDNLMKVMPGFKDELVGVANAAGLDGTDSMVLFKLATGELVPTFDEATGAVVGYTEGVADSVSATEAATEATEAHLDAVEEIGSAFLGARGAARDYADALAEANAAADENGKHWEDGTEAAQANAEAIDQVSSAALDNISAMNENGQATSGAMQAARDDIIATAMAMGASKGEAEAYADALGLTPEHIATQVELDIQSAAANAQSLASLMAETISQRYIATVDVEGDTAMFEGTIDGMVSLERPPVTMNIDADTAYAEDQVRTFQETVNAAGGTVTINGETMNGQQALDYLVTEINNGEGTVMINGTPVNAEGALLQLIDMINGSGGTVTIDGDNVPANLKTDRAVGHANSSTGTIDVDANTGAAESGINHTARDRNTDIDADAHTGGAESDLNRTSRDRDADIVADAQTGDAAAELARVARTRYATIVVRTVGAAAASAIRAGLGRAHGGPVFGPGTATSDSIPTWLSNGEHVMTAREVAMAGGQDAVYRMRELIRRGALRFADGGGVERGGYAPAPVAFSPAPSRVGGSLSLDPSGIEAAVQRALSGWRPSVQIGSRTIYGEMVAAERRFG